MIHNREAHPYFILRDVPDHIVFGETQRPTIGFANAIVNGKAGVEVVEKVISN
jgi:hypothetical protein